MGYMDTSSQPDLSKEIAELTKAVRRSNSFVRGFFLGMVRGLGATIGALLVTAVLVGLAWRAARTMNLDKYLAPLQSLQKLQELPSGPGFDPAILESLLAPQTQPSQRRK